MAFSQTHGKVSKKDCSQGLPVIEPIRFVISLSAWNSGRDRAGELYDANQLAFLITADQRPMNIWEGLAGFRR